MNVTPFRKELAALFEKTSKMLLDEKVTEHEASIRLKMVSDSILESTLRETERREADLS